MSNDTTRNGATQQTQQQFTTAQVLQDAENVQEVINEVLEGFKNHYGVEAELDRTPLDLDETGKREWIYKVRVTL